jgi:hypothetical protein
MAREQQPLSTIKLGRVLMLSQLRSFARDCVSQYATYDRLDGFYSLNIHDLPDFVQNEFAAMIMCDDNAWASEATGPDNKHWESKMLPALTRYLKNSTDRDEAIEFNNVWRDCVTDYMNNKMQELVDDSIPDVF